MGGGRVAWRGFLDGVRPEPVPCYCYIREISVSTRVLPRKGNSLPASSRMDVRVEWGRWSDLMEVSPHRYGGPCLDSVADLVRDFDVLAERLSLIALVLPGFEQDFIQAGGGIGMRVGQHRTGFGRGHDRAVAEHFPMH